MITYPGGAKYKSHCKQLSRQGVLTITCDPGVQRVGSCPVIIMITLLSQNELQLCYNVTILLAKSICIVKINTTYVCIVK